MMRLILRVPFVTVRRMIAFAKTFYQVIAYLAIGRVKGPASITFAPCRLTSQAAT